MQSFGALALAAALSAAAPAAQQSRPAALSDAGEVYVAELDADWNVSREIRMPCDVDQGCAVDLALSSAGARDACTSASTPSMPARSRSRA